MFYMRHIHFAICSEICLHLLLLFLFALGVGVASLRNTKHPIDLLFMAETAPLCPAAPRSSEINEQGRITSVKYEEVERIYDWGA